MQINMDINHLSHQYALALVAVLVATFLPNLGANNAIGISAAAALIVAYIIFKTKTIYAFQRWC